MGSNAKKSGKKGERLGKWAVMLQRAGKKGELPVRWALLLKRAGKRMRLWKNGL